MVPGHPPPGENDETAGFVSAAGGDSTARITCRQTFRKMRILSSSPMSDSLGDGRTWRQDEYEAASV